MKILQLLIAPYQGEGGIMTYTLYLLTDTGRIFSWLFEEKKWVEIKELPKEND